MAVSLGPGVLVALKLGKAIYMVACMYVRAHGHTALPAHHTHPALALGPTQTQHVLLEMQALIIGRPDLRDSQKAEILSALAVADKCLVDGADELLQLLSVASKAQRAIHAAA